MEISIDEIVKEEPAAEGFPFYIVLNCVGAKQFKIGPYENPQLAHNDANDLKDFLKVLVQNAKAT